MLLVPWPIFGHAVTLHFFANDLIMVFHFGLAVKEVTEALLPGGSLNPPSKAANPIMATMGGVFGPVGVFFIILKVFMAIGLFEDHYSFAVLSKGWGIVTATDIPLAWLAALVVYGQGHPAIDYLLLLAVADDALGMVIIAVFYQDPSSAAQPQWLLLVALAMLIAYTFRKWHYRMERPTHQSWIPYVLICGSMSWVGLIKAKLHPALALVPIVPFMPGPNMENLDTLDKVLEESMEDAAADGTKGSGRDTRTNTATDDGTGKVLEEHFNHARGRGITIQAGLYSGLIGHGVADALKVTEYDEDGNAHLYASTLDAFEHFWKSYVDFGLFLFALCNAGVKINGAPGGMTWAILLSLIIGKYTGIMIFFKISKKILNYPAPLGIRTRHVRMIGLIASLGLTVALFVSDVAFTDEKLKDDARLGALLSGFVGFACYAISLKFDFAAEDVEKEMKEQIKEEIQEMQMSTAVTTGQGVQLTEVTSDIVAKSGGADSAAVI
jgi:Na+/H+ antiporter NhaA